MPSKKNRSEYTLPCTHSLYPASRGRSDRLISCPGSAGRLDYLDLGFCTVLTTRQNSRAVQEDFARLRSSPVAPKHTKAPGPDVVITATGLDVRRGKNTQGWKSEFRELNTAALEGPREWCGRQIKWPSSRWRACSSVMWRPNQRGNSNAL
ncbi:hypothetical protein VTK73DRAFT_1860 [Phialemonium thermophilum]|uniref:Uncharacterized protein n=1 Tax=Phialemonium thermophilum TaxID=223376 RepID=A0ABR3X718_9PEZI